MHPDVNTELAIDLVCNVVAKRGAAVVTGVLAGSGRARDLVELADDVDADGVPLVRAVVLALDVAAVEADLATDMVCNVVAK
jgi:hypothetical protein